MVAMVTTSPLQAEAAKDDADHAYQTITEVAWKQVRSEHSIIMLTRDTFVNPNDAFVRILYNAYIIWQWF